MQVDEWTGVSECTLHTGHRCRTGVRWLLTSGARHGPIAATVKDLLL